MAKREAAASAGNSALEELKKIETDYEAKRQAVIEKINDEAAPKIREHVAALVEYSHYAAGAVKKELKALSHLMSGGNASSGGGGRMTKVQKSEAVAALPSVLRGKTLSSAEICDLLKIDRSSWQTIHKVAKADGLIVQHGERKDAKYSLAK